MSRDFGLLPATSVLPRGADIVRPTRHVRKVPIAEEVQCAAIRLKLRYQLPFGSDCNGHTSLLNASTGGPLRARRVGRSDRRTQSWKRPRYGHFRSHVTATDTQRIAKLASVPSFSKSRLRTATERFWWSRLHTTPKAVLLDIYIAIRTSGSTSLKVNTWSRSATSGTCWGQATRRSVRVAYHTAGPTLAKGRDGLLSCSHPLVMRRRSSWKSPRQTRWRRQTQRFGYHSKWHW